MTEAFMTRSNNTAIRYILDTGAYSLKYSLTTTSAGEVSWEGPEVLNFRHIRLDLYQLRIFIRSMIYEAKQVLLADLLYIDPTSQIHELPRIRWSRLIDDPSRTDYGFNFAKDQRNIDLYKDLDADTWLISRLLRLKSGGLVDKRLILDLDTTDTTDTTDIADIRLKQKAIKKLFSAADRFLDLLLVLTHLTGGQPARGPEKLSIKHTSAGSGYQRNVYLGQEMVYELTRYHKGQFLIYLLIDLFIYLPTNLPVYLFIY